ncbi:MAG TPA: GNAT family N-acetyltransferase [Burkholderiaceae bacterium]|nr:GNAT family N-acetyltransferase [Burkholderiaceae bacterium]
MPLAWTWRRFEDLGVDGVYDMLALRCRVFIVEQVPYLDPDGADRRAWHLLGRDEAGALLAYLRLLDPGVKSDEPAIGRVVVDAKLRGRGVGHELMRRGLAQCGSQWPQRAIVISAQAHLQQFYRQHGFQTVSDEYLDDGIAHIDMRRNAS